jgi:Tfp pilus assembly PilM family ATPase
MPNNPKIKMPPGFLSAIDWGKSLCFPWLARRIIAIDLGASQLKIAVVDEGFGQLKLVRQQMIDLQAEGLLTHEEIDRQLQEIINTLGNHPLAASLSQQVSLSHLVDLPAAQAGDIEAMIAQETRGLSGLSEGAIVYDYQRLNPFGHHVNPFWVSIAREEAVQSLIQRLAGPENNHTFREVTSTANALISAYQASADAKSKALLVDLGASSTTIVIVFQGQGVLATSLQIGGESFTQSIAALKNCAFEEAEQLKRTANLFEGPDHLPGFPAAVELWRQDVEKILKEWEEENNESRGIREPWTLLLSGGGSLQPGLLEYLRSRSSLLCESWPKPAAADFDLPLDRHAVTYGLILQACHQAPNAVSLLPRFLRQLKARQERLMKVNLAGIVLVLLLMFLLATGFSLKLAAAARKDAQLTLTRMALTNAAETATLLQDRELAFKKVEFLVRQQTRTADALATLRIMQKVREKRDLWFILMADHDSYSQGGTQPTPNTNLLAGVLTPVASSTNTPTTNQGYIVEFSLPDKTDDRFKVQREIVNDFKSERLFKSVDQLPPTQRSTNFFDPKQLPADRYFSLALDLEEKAWQRMAFEFPQATNGTNTAGAPKK